MTFGRALVLGAYILDVLAFPIQNPCDGDQGSVIDQIRITVAGAAGAVAVDLAKLGVSVTAAGAIGDDNVGNFLTATIEGFGIDVRFLARKEGLMSSATILPVRPNGERSIWHVRGAINQLTGQDVEQVDLDNVDVLHVGGPDALGRFAGEPLSRFLKQAKDHHVRVTMDLLGPTSEKTLPRLAPLLPYVDDFLPNMSQICRLADRRDPLDAADFILNQGVGCVFVTLGSEGSLVSSTEGAVRIPALEVEAIDSTGCGDAFCAGVILGRLWGWDDLESGRLGSVAGGLVATGLGSDAGIRDIESTTGRLQDLGPSWKVR